MKMLSDDEINDLRRLNYPKYRHRFCICGIFGKTWCKGCGFAVCGNHFHVCIPFKDVLAKLKEKVKKYGNK